MNKQEQVRAIVKAFPHNDALVIARALELAEVAAPAMDNVVPSSEIRAFGVRAGAIAEQFHQANAARSFIEKNEADA